MKEEYASYRKLRNEKKEILMNRVEYVRLFRRYQHSYEHLTKPAPFFASLILLYTTSGREQDPDVMLDFLVCMNRMHNEYALNYVNHYDYYIERIRATERHYAKVEKLFINLAYHWFEFFDLSHEIEKNYDGQVVDDIFNFLPRMQIDVASDNNAQIISWFTKYLKKKYKVQVEI